MEALQAQHERIHALTNARGIATGHAFKLKGHPRADQNKQYLIVATQLDFASNEHEAAASGGATFHASFEAILADTQYRSPRQTPKPLIHSVQTAKVVGPAGEEIYTDEVTTPTLAAKPLRGPPLRPPARHAAERQSMRVSACHAAVSSTSRGRRGFRDRQGRFEHGEIRRPSGTCAGHEGSGILAADRAVFSSARLCLRRTLLG